MEETETSDAAPGASTSGETPQTRSSGRDRWGGGGEGEGWRGCRVPGSTAGALLRLGLPWGRGLGAGTPGTWSLEDGSANGSLDAGGRAGDLSPLESWALQDTPWVPSRFDICKGKGRSDDCS